MESNPNDQQRTLDADAARRVRHEALEEAARIADAVAAECCDRRDKAVIVAEAIRQKIVDG